MFEVFNHPVTRRREARVMLAQSIGIAASGLAAWLMIVAGSAKNVVQLRAPAHCAACGRRLERRGRCRCTEDDRGA